MIEASTKFKKATVGDLLKVAKVVRKAKSEKSEVIIPNLRDSRNWTFETHTDAALGNLNDGIDSTGAHIIFASNKKGKMAALDWKSSMVKRVVRSSLAAEIMVLIDGIENALHLRNMMEELLNLPKNSIPIKATVDNNSLVASLNSTSSVDDKRLRRDIGAVKQMLERKEVTEVGWCPGNEQLADTMTKATAPAHRLLQAIQTVGS